MHDSCGLSLSDAGLAMMITEIAPGATTREVRPLRGGLVTATFSVDTNAGDLVIKIFRPTDEQASLEWERLTFAQRVDLPVPEPVALDADGRWFGSPALVMSRLPGRGDVRPTDLDGWLRQIAHALVAIHETDIAGAAGALLPPDDWGSWGFLNHGNWASSPLIDRSLAAIQRHRPSRNGSWVLTHGDYHPGNTLWSQDSLSGIVDWNTARLGSRWFDLAYCRADVALLFGMRGVRRLTQHYLDLAGTTPVDLPVFDLVCGLEARRSGASRWLSAYRHQGCTDSRRQFAARVTPFLRQALAELGA